MDSKVLWKIGLAIVAGITSGYLIAAKFGIIAGLTIGTVIAALIADIKAIRESFPFIWQELRIGFVSGDLKHKPSHLTSFAKRGRFIRYSFEIIIMATLMLGVFYLSATIPALILQMWFPNHFGRSAGLGFTMMFLAIVTVGVMVACIIGIEYVSRRETHSLRWLIIRRIGRFTRDLSGPDPKSGPSGPFPNTDDSCASRCRSVRGNLVEIESLAMLSVLCTLCIVGPLLVPIGLLMISLCLICALIDTLLTAYFAIATSRGTSAGITTFVAILVEYACYPSIGVSGWEIVRILAFSIVGAGIGVLLYRLRMKLILRQTAEELALAS